MASNIGLGRGPNDAVLGHYTLQGSAWQPALQESSTLFKAIVSDTAGPIEQLIEKEPTKLNVFRLVLYWDSSALATGEENKAEEPNTAVNVKHRTLLMLAAFHGSLRVLSCLLSQGADPKVATPDGLTVYDVSVHIVLCWPCGHLFAFSRFIGTRMTVEHGLQKLGRAAQRGSHVPANMFFHWLSSCEAHPVHTLRCSPLYYLRHYH